ncbi:MAG: hypothetical protein V2A62_03775 [Candidatus Woesearchaeota archaeon]
MTDEDKTPPESKKDDWFIPEGSDIETCFGLNPEATAIPLRFKKKSSFGKGYYYVFGVLTAVGTLLAINEVRSYYAPSSRIKYYPSIEAAPSPLEKQVESSAEATPWLTLPTIVPVDRPCDENPECYGYKKKVGALESALAQKSAPTKIESPQIVLPSPDVISSPEVIYSDAVSLSDLTFVVAATPSLEKAVDPAPVVLVQNSISTNSLPTEENLLSKTLKPQPEDNTFNSPRIYEQAVDARDRLFGKSTLSEIAPKPVVPSLPVFPENALLELTLQGVCCAPPNWYDRFTAPGSFNKKGFMNLFHQYVKERGAAEFLNDYKRDDYFDVFAISHSKESGYCAKARMFGDRVDQWVGNSKKEVKACVLYKRCK